MSQAIEWGGAKDAVAGKRIAPFAEVEVTRQDRRSSLVAVRDQVVEVFILRRAQRLEREVVDDGAGTLTSCFSLCL